MINNTFDLKILDLHWLDKLDEKDDLCVHGHVFLKIGDVVVADENSFDISISSTALYLMRSIESDYKPGDFGSQLLPCCGHLMIKKSENKVIIVGCPNGIDWTIVHLPSNKIKHTTKMGVEVIIDEELYKETVLNFVDRIEQFYKDSQPKNPPIEESDREGYITFWNEWKFLRDKWK